MKHADGYMCSDSVDLIRDAGSMLVICTMKADMVTLTLLLGPISVLFFSDNMYV
jgi:hypothetical protein